MEESDFDIIDDDYKNNEDKYIKKGQNQEHIDEAREKVFDSILSFCGQRLTLQQLLKFAKQFARFLKNHANRPLENIMCQYEDMKQKYTDILELYDDITCEWKTLSLNRKKLDEMKSNKTDTSGIENDIVKCKMRRNEKEKEIPILLDERKKIKKRLKDRKLQSIPVEGGRPIKIKSKKDFVMRYFRIEENSDVSNEFRAELSWLYMECENEYDLCHKIYPFWSGSLRQDVITFMDSSKEIKGNYQLKSGELSQLKRM
eukprot:159858_1